MNAVIERCGSSGLFDYIPLATLNWTKEFKKAKTQREKEKFIVNWWVPVFKGAELQIISKHETNETHYDRELRRYNMAKELFNEKLAELTKKYNGKYVAISEGQIEAGDSKDEVKKKIFQKVGRVSMYLTKIGEKEEKIYKLRKHRRLLTE